MQQSKPTNKQLNSTGNYTVAIQSNNQIVNVTVTNGSGYQNPPLLSSPNTPIVGQLMSYPGGLKVWDGYDWVDVLENPLDMPPYEFMVNRETDLTFHDEAKLREKYKILQDAWNKYLMTLKLVRDYSDKEEL